MLNPSVWLDGDTACHWGFTQSERYSEEDEIQQNGKLHHYLNLGTMDRRDPDVEPTELGQPNALQSLD